MASYQARHAPRHAKPRQPRVLRVHKAVVRPAVGSSLGLAVIATATAGVAAPDTAKNPSSDFDFTPEAKAQAVELSSVQAEDAARIAADRAAVNVSRSAVREQDRRAAKAEAAEKARKAAEAEARKEAEERAQAILANARANPKAAAQQLLGEFGFSQGEWPCLEALWTGESSWNYTATNPSSGAYGIPQALPGYKMASAGADWQTNPLTQIRWGLDYIRQSYGTPCNAYNTWQARYPHWY
jgi:hypothetical protein